MLHTRLTEMFGLEHPLVSAPMVQHSGGRLAGAVSAAGALGSFGGMSPGREPSWVHDEVAAIRAQTERPFAIGFITPFLPRAERFLDAALDAEVAAVWFSFADPGPWAVRARDVGAKVICQVQDHDSASQAIDSGADVLVAQGTEAGGHTGMMSLLPFLTSLVERHPQVPVLAAGGISDGRALAAALLAGADGAVAGTAFLATPEAVEVDDGYKQLIVDSDGTDTVLTHAYDIVSGLPWPPSIHDRVRRNRFTEEWQGRENELRSRRDEVAAGVSSTGEQAAVRYGQGAGAIRSVRPAAEVVRSMSESAEAVLRQRPAALLRD